jgi:hypothetical protein
MFQNIEFKTEAEQRDTVELILGPGSDMMFLTVEETDESNKHQDFSLHWR